MPDVPPPEECRSLVDATPESGRDSAEWEREWAALEVRYVGDSRPGNDLADPDHPARQRLWIRVNGRLSDDPLLHLAAFTYASDMTLLGASLIPHGVFIAGHEVQAASLDHSIWFHRPFRADEWWLYDQSSPSASGGRGLSLARVFTQDGRLVASVAQEGLIRVVR
jgi:acyl-CoA thioesterase-2